MQKRVRHIIRFFVFSLCIFATGIAGAQHAGNMQESNLDDGVHRFILRAADTSNLDSIHFYLHKSIELAKADRQYPLEEIYAAAGTIYQRQTLYDHALKNYFEALRSYEQKQDSLQMAEMLDRIGGIYLITHDLDEALRFFVRSHLIYELAGNASGMITAGIDIGAVYQKRGDYEAALSKYKYVLRNADFTNLRREKAVVLGNIGSTYMEMREPDSALIFLKEALKIKNQYSTDESIAHTLNDLSETMLSLNNWTLAKNYADSAMAFASKAKSANQLRYAWLNLSLSFAGMNRYADAYQARLRYSALNDSLFGIEKERMFKELRVMYETEKKDHAILSLQRENENADLRKKMYLALAIVILLVALALINWQRMRIRRNKEMLEREKEIDRMKTNFFANISHEFRTPLTLILSPLESLIESATGNAKSRLIAIRKSATRLLMLINQILDLSKIEAGGMRVEESQTDIAGIMKNLADEFRPLCEDRNITLNFRGTSETHNVICDGPKVETIVTNLLSNALKYTPEQGCIDVEITFPGRDLVQIVVTDSGRGIDPHILPHIFDRYFIGDGSSLAQHGAGTGIGLALTKQLVNLLSGSVSVESEPGQGTRFSLSIPVKPAVAGSTAQTWIAAKASGHITEIQPVAIHDEKAGTPTPERDILLVIEDNPELRTYMYELFNGQYEVKLAENGEAGLVLAQKIIPDLVISDVMMPVMDGYEVCKKLKQDERTSHIPVILLTAKTSVASRLTGLETEADLYLNKPFIEKEVLLYVRNLLDSRRKLRARYKRELIIRPAEIAVNSIDEQFLHKLMTVLEKHYANSDFSVEQLGREVGMSRSQIHRKLQALTNESSSRFIRAFRLRKAMDLLKSNAGTVAEISFLVGFNSPSYFNKCFLDQYGFTPTEAILEP